MKSGFVLFTNKECRKLFLAQAEAYGSFHPIGNPEPLVVYSVSDSDLIPVVKELAAQHQGRLQQSFKPTRL